MALLIYSALGLFLIAGVGLILYCLIRNSRHPESTEVREVSTPPTTPTAPGDDWHTVLKELRERVSKPPAFAAGPLAPPTQPPVNAAIDRGVAYLKKQTQMLPNALTATPYQVGMAALAGLALLHCDVPTDDPSVIRIAHLVRASCGGLNNTYELSTSIWFLDRLGDKQDAARIRSLALQLMAAQTVNGGWGYTCRRLETDDEMKLLAQAQNSAARLAEQARLRTARPELHRARSAETSGTRRTKEPVKGPPVLRIERGESLVLRPHVCYDDNSATQFAILALWVARKYGVPVDRALALAEDRFRAAQNPDGSWGYNLPNATRRTDSMTCAGLLTLAVGRGLRRGNTGEDVALDRGLLFLGARLGQGQPLTEAERRQVRGRAADVERRFAEYLTMVRKIHDVTERLTKIDAELVAIAERAKREQQVLLKLGPTDSRATVKKHTQELQALVRQHADLLKKGHELEAHGNELSDQVRAIYPTGDSFRGTLIPANSWGDLYFLWSVERMAVLYDLKTIGGQDWYAWGMRILLAAQQPDGSWVDAFPGVPDTSFALLFLKRANVATDLTAMQNLLGKVRDPVRGRTVPSPSFRTRERP